MIRVGRVVEKQGKILSVCFSRPEACESCSMCGNARNNTVVHIQGEAQVGDQVEVDMPDAQVLKVSLISYMLPLAGLLLGLWTGTQLFKDREFLVMLSGFVLMAIALVLLKLVDRKAAISPQWQPKLIRIIKEEDLISSQPESETVNEI